MENILWVILVVLIFTIIVDWLLLPRKVEAIVDKLDRIADILENKS